MKMEETNKEVAILNQTIQKKKREADVMKEQTKILLEKVTTEAKSSNVVAEEANAIEASAKIVLDASEPVKNEAEKAYALAVPALENARKEVDNLEAAYIQELKGFSKPNDKALDECIVNNYITQKPNLKPKFADWKFNQTVMKEPLKFKDSLRVVMQDIENKTED